MQVLQPIDVWPEYSKKFKTFQVSVCTGRNKEFKTKFHVRNESGGQVELICSFGSVPEVSFKFPGCFCVVTFVRNLFVNINTFNGFIKVVIALEDRLQYIHN